MENSELRNIAKTEFDKHTMFMGNPMAWTAWKMAFDRCYKMFVSSPASIEVKDEKVDYCECPDFGYYTILSLKICKRCNRFKPISYEPNP